jgi:hypothetical protein
LPKLGAERQDLFEETIGKSFLQAIVIAQENKIPLYSDDLGTRLFANSEFGVSGFWTQAVAIHELNEKLISQEEYNNIAVRLILMGYRHTTINGAVLIEAARQSEWVTKHPFLAVVETLTKPQMELKSIVGVAVEFFYLLWQQPILDMRRDSLIMAMLDALTRGRRKDVVLKALDAVIRARFRLAPLIENHLLQVMVAWHSLKV